MKRVMKFNVYEDNKNRRLLYTKNLTPGKTFFEENLIRDKGVEYRSWDVTRSKLGAAIKKGISQIGLKEGDVVLYLGASHGFTPTYVSDIISEEGFVFCLDFAPRVVRDLVFICEERKNMAPILADANHPEEYKEQITKEVDIIFQDIAQRSQVRIFLKNCDAFLKKGGFGLLALKARSIDVSMKPKQVFKEARKQLEQHKGIIIVDYKELYPFEKDHSFFLIKKK